jgi:hypothetical protein
MAQPLPPSFLLSLNLLRKSLIHENTIAASDICGGGSVHTFYVGSNDCRPPRRSLASSSPTLEQGSRFELPKAQTTHR